MEVPSSDFDDIRPLNNDEVKDAIETLVANDDFERAFRYIKPDVNWKEFCEIMRSFKTKEDFKSKLAYEAVMMVAGKTTFSLTVSGRSRLPEDKKPCTFISNHRDIILDAAFLNVMLYDVGYGMTQVAIGDNLQHLADGHIALHNKAVVQADKRLNPRPDQEVIAIR